MRSDIPTFDDNLHTSIRGHPLIHHARTQPNDHRLPYLHSAITQSFGSFPSWTNHFNDEALPA